MRFRKVCSKEWPMCYTAASLTLDGSLYAVFASEDRDNTGAVLMHGETETPLWKTPGGCMGIVQVPGKDEFLCIQRFYPIFQSENAEISWYYKREGIWKRKVLDTVPFVHRIAIVKENKRLYLIISRLCREKAFPEDWSSSGCVYACEMDLLHRRIGQKNRILDGLYQNHGLVKIASHNDICLIAHQNGIHEITMDEKGFWTTKQIYSQPCSDVAVGRRGEGEVYEELGIITPFHGDTFQIIRKTGNNWEEVFGLQDHFGHGLWGGLIAEKESYLVGFRGGTKGIYCIWVEKGGYRITPVDMGVGNANLTVFRWGQTDYIGAANRESNTYSIYEAEEN